jgi:outer membrane protein TolC
MNKMYLKNKILIAACFIYAGMSLNAQSIASGTSVMRASIDDCYEWSRENFPLIHQLDIVDKATHYNVSNASNGNLPQINLNGQASYQSAVTNFPIDLPNVEVPTVGKDQYKIYGEVYQPLTNFSNVKTLKRQIEINGEIEKQQVEVDLYKLKDRINQTYFGILLISEKIEQFEIIISDLDSALVKVEAAISNGTATLTDKSLLNVERISIMQQIDENRSNRKAFLSMLSILTGKTISETTVLDKPKILTGTSEIRRPELQLFKLQNDAIDIKSKQLSNRLLPNLGLFAQGGYGRPALNFLSNDFDFYYIGGVKFNWNISNYYGHKNAKKLLQTVSDKISTQRETFLRNTELSQAQQSSEILKYEGLVKTDNKIVNLRADILKTAKVQLDNGLITTIDYVKYLNDVNRAKQNLLLHGTQLLLAQHNLKITTGN